MSEATSNEGTMLPPPPTGKVAKLRQLVQEDTTGLHPRLHLANTLMRILPTGGSGARRAAILRMAGFQIGAGTLVRGMLRISGPKNLYQNLVIGQGCRIDARVTLDLEAPLLIGDRVTIGHEAMILTSSHEIGPKEHRAGEMVRAPVRIEAGAWLGARCIILPGVTIGEGAIVAAGALVNKDVPPHTRVSGTPAKVVEELVVA
ncbi:MAG: acyltransferase [Chloroflexi bacterium OHK40]